MESCTSGNAFLKPSMSSAASRALPHASSNPRRSSRTVSGQIFLGFPFSLFLPEPSSSLVWLFYSCSFWPHDKATSVIFPPMMQPSSSCPVLYRILLFIIYPSTRHAISSQPYVMRRLHLLLFATVIGHVSAPYRSALSTMDSLSWTLVSTLQSLLFYVVSNPPNTAF